jgi:hypothetical protein
MTGMAPEDFQAIGEAAVTCASLEYEMAVIVVLPDHDADPELLLSESGHLSKQLKRAASLLLAVDANLGAELEEWRRRAETKHVVNSWPIQQSVVGLFPRDLPGPADSVRTEKGGGV